MNTSANSAPSCCIRLLDQARRDSACRQRSETSYSTVEVLYTISSQDTVFRNPKAVPYLDFTFGTSTQAEVDRNWYVTRRLQFDLFGVRVLGRTWFHFIAITESLLQISLSIPESRRDRSRTYIERDLLHRTLVRCLLY